MIPRHAPDEGAIAPSPRRNAGLKIDDPSQLSRVELRILWEREMGFKASRSFGRDILTLGISHGRQERQHGGLAKSVTKELDYLLAQVLRDDRADGGAALSSPLPRVGTVLVREWRGVTRHVTVTQNGFLWNDKTHGSLSTIARAITGSHWNGPRFFGLRSRQARPEKRHGRA